MIMKILPLVIICVLIIAVPSLWANWIEDGIPICVASGDQLYPASVSDGSGGAIVIWDENSSGSSHIYAQRVSASGVVQWTLEGVLLCNAPGVMDSKRIIADGLGGAIVAWCDSRSGSRYVYAQRVNALGAVQWTTGGVAICTAASVPLYPEIASDGLGGAIVAWCDDRNGNPSVYAQKVNAMGTIQWATEGVPLCTASGDRGFLTIASDGLRGAIIEWQDNRNGDYDIYAQRVNAMGAVQWTTDGVAICLASGDQLDPTSISDGAGGVIVIWFDGRGGGDHAGIYAQRVDASGSVQWTANGVALCVGGENILGYDITSDDLGGAIVAWLGSSNGVQTQKVSASGAVQWTAGGVPFLAGSNVGPKIICDGAGGAIVAWGGGNIYAQRVNTAGAIQWMTGGVALCAAAGDQNNPTISSDGAGGALTTWHDFRNGNWDIYNVRVDANGYAPPAKSPKTPKGLSGTPVYYNGNPIALLIAWNHNAESNISHYNIYKDTSEDFIPGLTNVLASAVDTFLYDGQWRWTPFVYYKISAVDSNGDESDFALLRPDDVTGVGSSGAPQTTYLSQNYPNPFNPTTRIAFGLKAPGTVSLRIYDTSGRLMRVLVEGDRAAGQYSQLWDGKDSSGRNAASGIYFYRLDAGAFTQTRKLVLLR